jgi:hypothetical protein
MGIKMQTPDGEIEISAEAYMALVDMGATIGSKLKTVYNEENGGTFTMISTLKIPKDWTWVVGSELGKKKHLQISNGKRALLLMNCYERKDHPRHPD